MGFHLRKSFNFKGIRFNLSNSGIGFSIGVKGLRFGIDGKGRKYIGGGKGILRYRKQLSGQTSPNGYYKKNNQEFFQWYEILFLLLCITNAIFIIIFISKNIHGLL